MSGVTSLVELVGGECVFNGATPFRYSYGLQDMQECYSMIVILLLQLLTACLNQCNKGRYKTTSYRCGTRRFYKSDKSLQKIDKHCNIGIG